MRNACYSRFETRKMIKVAWHSLSGVYLDPLHSLATPMQSSGQFVDTESSVQQVRFYSTRSATGSVIETNRHAWFQSDAATAAIDPIFCAILASLYMA